MSTQLRGHRTDAIAVTLLVVGALAALGIWSDLAGPFGSVADGVSGALLGDARVLVPLALGSAGILMGVERGSDGAARGGIRVGVGLLLVAFALGGMLHVGGEAPRTWDVDILADAGGVIGAAVGRPLVALTGHVGAWVVLAAVLGLGLLITAGVSLVEVATFIRSFGRGCARGVRRTSAALRSSLTFGAESPAVEADLPDGSEIGSDSPIDVELAPDEPVLELESDPESERPTVAAILEDDDFAARTAPVGVVADGEVRPPPSEWKLPDPQILRRSEERAFDERLVAQGGEVLERTMADFGVEARLVGATVGPTVTRYELELASGVKVNKVTALAHDVAYAMASPDVRILAPIPGRSAIGIEVPNQQRQLVTLGDILASQDVDPAAHPLEVGLGRDIAGRPMMIDLSTMPHLLIAGQTGAGKSSCINSIITSILMRSTPEQARLILVDPKRVELGVYSGLPHLLTDVVTNPKRAANALDWAVKEMEMRYDLLAEVGVRDISGYNAMHDRGELPTAEALDPDTNKSYRRLPFILIVVDELNDLMMVAARDVEASICRIAQMARAVGIHLVIATQRPSVNVITGVIKANIPSRLAFSVTALADSRVILDAPGAEKLIGQGDGLMLTASSSRAQRVQGSWVDETCVRRVVAHWRRQCAQPEYIPELEAAESTGVGVGVADNDTDELLDQAMELVVRSGLGSTSMLQRKLRVGFARAGRIMDLLERKGIVGPSEGSKARAVLMTVEEFEESLASA